jgi:hypothetical protein
LETATPRFHATRCARLIGSVSASAAVALIEILQTKTRLRIDAGRAALTSP